MPLNRRTESLNESEELDIDSGEILSTEQPNAEEGSDNGWFKLFEEGLKALSDIGNANVRLYVYMIRNMNSANIISRTQEQMSKETGLSSKYISKRLSEMDTEGLLVVGRNHYMVNPDVIFKGTPAKRSKAVFNYYARRRKNLTKPISK